MQRGKCSLAPIAAQRLVLLHLHQHQLLLLLHLLVV
jgi:hypothetical protein